MSYYNRIARTLETGSHTDEDISDILSMVRQLERQAQANAITLGEVRRELDAVMAERMGWKQQIATNGKIVKEAQQIIKEAQQIISTSQPALALSGLLSAMEAARQDVTVALLPGVGAVIELQDLETGERAEYAARDLDDAVTMARLDQGEL